jgi:hypothetical protein
MNEDETYSHPVTIDLQKLFETQGTIKDIVEMTLGGNLALADLKRLQWSTDDKETSSGNFSVCTSAKNQFLFQKDDHCKTQISPLIQCKFEHFMSPYYN